jgi:general secretion pathway protein L
MSDQLLLYINRAADSYHWCWLDAHQQPLPGSEARGSLEQLADALPPGNHQAWLILPGTKVVVRPLEYGEKEKRHLRKLLPFQLEETVVGDVERFHFALGPLQGGKTSVAYIEKAWLQEVFQSLKGIGIEVVRCWSAPLTLPLATDPQDADTPCWTLQAQDGVLLVRQAPLLGFSVDLRHARLALELLLNHQGQTQPRIWLRATSEEELQQALDSLPPGLESQIDRQELVGPWDRAYAQAALDLCQGEFSQRLPIDRWWSDWRKVALVAAACLAVHLGTQMYQIREFRQENLTIRQQIEQVYRQVVPTGPVLDAERQLSGLVRQLEPAGQSTSLVKLLSQVFPPLAESGVSLRSVQYSGESGEINLQLQADEFNAIQNLARQIEQQGLRAELLGASAQGNSHSARLKISANR